MCAMLLVLLVAVAPCSAQTLLDHVTIVGHAGGTSNCTGFFPLIERQMVLPEGCVVELFEFELTSFRSNLGPPFGVELSFLSNTNTSIRFGDWTGPVALGTVVTRLSSESGFDTLLGLTSQGTRVPELRGNVCWPTGGLAIDFDMGVEVRALGTPGPVAVHHGTWTTLRHLFR